MAKAIRNCFVSYHHEYDGNYMKNLRNMKSGMAVADYSLKEDISHLNEHTIYKKIRDKMRNCSVTIILVGSRTGHRKWIDWELWASLRGYIHPTDSYKSFKPNGLLAIYLPDQWSHSVPERLQDNIDSGYAVSMKWENIESDFESKVSLAHWRRTNNTYKINNSRGKIDRNYFNFLGIKL